jgi:hypothetical protein
MAIHRHHDEQGLCRRHNSSHRIDGELLHHAVDWRGQQRTVTYASRGDGACVDQP